MDISIIICTHNPEERIFSRCLTAIQNLDTTGLDIEVLLVDNNSHPAINTFGYVTKFLKNNSKAKYIKEERPGLTYARMAGWLKANAPIIIFFDDDNEPSKNYAVDAHNILLKRNEIGLVGPGIIDVDFIDGSNKWLETERPLLQQIVMHEELYSNNKTSYEECYPFGTGLIVRKEVMQKYYDIVSNQKEISDRKGNSLVSGGDMQIVWCGIKIGYYAGRSPLLKIVHIIPANRTTTRYIKKLSYSLGYSSVKTKLGIFPEDEHKIKSEKKTFLSFYFLMIKYFIVHSSQPKKLLIRDVPNLIGNASGYYFAFEEKKPRWLRITEKIFGLHHHE